MVPSIKEEELAHSILLSMGEVSLKTITGRVGQSAETMGLTIVIQWTCTYTLQVKSFDFTADSLKQLSILPLSPEKIPHLTKQLLRVIQPKL